MRPDQSRLVVLQRRRVRNTRALEIAAAWASASVTASLVGAERHEQIVDQVRGSGTRTRAVGSLPNIVAELGNGGDVVVIIGWDMDNEPALMVGSDALARSATSLRTIYPDGFVAVDQPATRALIVDFDDDDFFAEQVRLIVRD